MKNIITNIAATLGCAAVIALGVFAFSDNTVAAPSGGGPLTFNPQVLVNSGTNHVLHNTTQTTAWGAGGLTTTTTPIAHIDCSTGQNVAYDISFAQNIAGTTNNFQFIWVPAITFGQSTNYPTVVGNYITNTVAGNGTTTVHFGFSTNIGAFSDYYLLQIVNTNAATTDLTNIVITPNVK